MPFHAKELRKGRQSLPGQIYLISTVSHRRERFFEEWSAAHAVCRELHASSDVTSLAWVLMPDHLHWLLQLQQSSLQDVLQRFKSRSAIQANRALKRSGRVWQPGYHDHALRRNEDLKAAARYLIANPLRAGLVRSVRQYPFWDAAWL